MPTPDGKLTQEEREEAIRKAARLGDEPLVEDLINKAEMIGGTARDNPPLSMKGPAEEILQIVRAELVKRLSEKK